MTACSTEAASAWSSVQVAKENTRKSVRSAHITFTTEQAMIHSYFTTLRTVELFLGYITLSFM